MYNTHLIQGLFLGYKSQQAPTSSYTAVSRVGALDPAILHL